MSNPLPERYLWAIGEGIKTYQKGAVLANRYRFVGAQLVVDTQPELPPETPPDIPDEFLPYLRLSPYQLHIPQIHALLGPRQDVLEGNIALLEQAAIVFKPCLRPEQVAANSAAAELAVPPTQPLGNIENVLLLPPLTQVWASATALRQLNWLWQIAQLWQPLSSTAVASSLLMPKLLRVDGATVRLLELQVEADVTASNVNLRQLGQLW
ncbi:MAG: serine/threonine protein phosphatase, partial [Cyanothece sp. SIO1E1]|nr:serine/threonine protein phosphatase [Cyanothece sp. SIO1E1]